MSIRGLIREFDWLATHCTALVAVWGHRHHELAGCGDLAAVLRTVRADPDPVLGALLSENAAGCAVAGRVVLQALLPKMVLMAGRDPQAGLDDYLGALWLRICDYPLERRPRQIAANLTLDTLKAVHAERGPTVVTLDRAEVDSAPWLRGESPRGPDPHSLLRSALDHGLVDPHTHAVLASVYAEGCSREEAAHRFQVSPTTIMRRCRGGLRTLAEHAPTLAAASR